MHRSIRFFLLAVVFLLASLVIFSIVGAFYGADWSKKFFNSSPLMLFWFALTLSFLPAFFRSRHLRKSPGLWIMHLACGLVLIGSMWGSDDGHRIRNHLFDTNKVPGGFMTIYEGHAENRIMSRHHEERLVELPFSIFLKDFRMDHYWDEGRLIIRSPIGRIYVMHARQGNVIEPGEGVSSIKVIRGFKKLIVITREDTKKVDDDSGPGSNPALVVELTYPDKTQRRQYVFQRFPGRNILADGWAMQYRLGTKDYFSHIDVIKNGKPEYHKVIQVNDPLHYGGYFFYQASYDADQGRYTVLSVTSDSGYQLVFAGFLLLSIGVFWHFWLQPILRRSYTRGGHGD